MTISFVRKSLRRALLVSLAVPAVPIGLTAGCGDNIVVDGTGSTGTGGSSAVCALASTQQIPPSDICTGFFSLKGPASACSPGAYGQLTSAQCAELCPPSSANPSASECWANDADAGSAVLSCAYVQPCGTGRRPAGLVPAEAMGAPASDTVARFLSEAAHLEAAAVIAFEQLARDLEAHAAPRTLVLSARRAAREEAVHAATMRRHAARAGGQAWPVRVAATPSRTLEAIAVENAVEGCVRETFGAVVAMRQAERARGGRLRRSLRRIAREEAGHAELSWKVARWLSGELTEAAARRVDEARRGAVEALAHEVARDPHRSLIDELGLPPAAEARAALDVLRASLWSGDRESKAPREESLGERCAPRRRGCTAPAGAVSS
jgi:hypothetical protein